MIHDKSISNGALACKKMRSLTGLTQREYGRLVGCDQGTVSNYENGVTNISFERFLEHFNKLPINEIQIEGYLFTKTK